MAKTVALDWQAFMAGDVRPKKQTVPVALLSAMGTASAMSIPHLVSANIIADGMMHAFSPIISVIQGISYPISFIGMAAGMLLISVGQRHRGISMIKWAAIGYIGMQLVPGIMHMVSMVGDQMSTMPTK